MSVSVCPIVLGHYITGGAGCTCPRSTFEERPTGGLVVCIQIQCRVLSGMRRPTTNMSVWWHGSTLLELRPTVRVCQQRRWHSSAGWRVCRRYDRRSAGRYLRPGIQRQVLLRALERSILRRSAPDPVRARGPFQGHAGMERRRRRNGAAGLDAILARLRQFNQPRKTDGNTLGCVTDNDVLSQPAFFRAETQQGRCCRCTEGSGECECGNGPDKTSNREQRRTSRHSGSWCVALEKYPGAQTATMARLSSGVVLISKPSDLNVPPWQMVSALLSGEPLRVASMVGGAGDSDHQRDHASHMLGPVARQTRRGRDRDDGNMAGKDAWIRRCQ